MKKIGSKIFLVIFCCSVFAIALSGFITIGESIKTTTINAEELLLSRAQSYAAKFSTQLLVIEDKVQEMEIFIKSTIDFEKLKKDKAYLAKYETQLAEYIKRFAENRTNSNSGWVYFDPKWSDSPHDVFYVDGDADGVADRQKYVPFSFYDNTPTVDDDKQWWYGPVNKKGIFWTNPYEWELANGTTIEVVSCALPVYIDDELVCVVGTYYLFDEMYKEVTSAKVYDTGYTALLNEKLDIIIHPTLKSGTRFTSDNLLTAKDGAYRELAEEIMKSPNGVVSNEINGQKRLTAFAKLSNGWVIEFIAPENEVYAPVTKLSITIFIILAFSIAAAFIVAHFMGKYIAKPIQKIVKDAQILGEGNLDVKVEVSSKDETKILANSLNSMTANIKSLQDDLYKKAYFDELTGAQNLVRFKIVAEKILEANKEKSYVIVKFDIDRFKMLNEILGFDEGDNVLKNTVLALNKIMDAKTETFGRVSADVFVAMMRCDVEELNRRDRLFLKYFNSLNPVLNNYTISFFEGRYFLTKGEVDINSAYEKANIAHKLAKEKEDTKVCVYDEAVQKIAIEEKDMENRMEDALKNGEFKMFLQPKYHLESRRIAGAEALVRWQDSTGKITPPNAFVPFFERNGFLLKIDFYMLKHACRTIKEWIENGIEPVVISVNFSRLHLRDITFTDKIWNTIKKFDIPARYLEVELTETTMLYNIDTLLSLLTKLHSKGIKLSMDDFGTGYSSLGLLKNLPVDAVKLDRSFFVDATDESRAYTVIESIIEMAKKLGIQTVAEGVEEEKHVTLLHKLDCDCVQGFYFAKPMPKDEFNALFYKQEKDID